MFEAMEAGFRPCHRCRPDIEVEYSNRNIDGASTVNEALIKIYDGYLNTHSINDLAESLFISARHLRKLFVENIGMPPIKIAKYHKSIFAKKLLLYSTMPITKVAFASGFRSVRQFNDVFKKLFDITPTAFRKKSVSNNATVDCMTLQIIYKKPFHFKQMLSFMKDQLIEGIEKINDNCYSRTFRINDAKGYFTISNDAVKSVLKLDIHSDDVRCYMTIYNKVRKMFDIDCNVIAISKHLSKDNLLCKGMLDGQILRLPIAFDPFEFIIKAILIQQASLKSATTLVSQIAKKMDCKTDSTYPNGLDYFFPSQDEFHFLNLDGIGITKTSQNIIKCILDNLSKNDLSLTYNQSFNKFYDDFSKIKGIENCTIQNVAMRGLGMVDSFPIKDLNIIKTLTINNIKPTTEEIAKISENWRPYRAYAALCLWNTKR
jgi:AraC family transcriptional regulator of adaptative response / DNA-3-methyladenine glycosylase II